MVTAGRGKRKGRATAVGKSLPRGRRGAYSLTVVEAGAGMADRSSHDREVVVVVDGCGGRLWDMVP